MVKDIPQKSRLESVASAPHSSTSEFVCHQTHKTYGLTIVRITRSSISCITSWSFMEFYGYRKKICSTRWFPCFSVSMLKYYFIQYSNISIFYILILHIMESKVYNWRHFYSEFIILQFRSNFKERLGLKISPILYQSNLSALN